MLRCALLAALASYGAAPAVELADPIPAPIPKGGVRIELETIATGLVAPNHLTHAGDGSGRLFVVDQPGQVRRIEDGALAPTPFLDVSERLVTSSLLAPERGLLGLAFHPGFADPNHPGFQKLYTYTSEPVDGPADFTSTEPLPAGVGFDHQSVIAEWTVDAADPDRVDPATRREILRIDQPQANHNGGALVFGPEGLLYVGLGDGGGADDQGPGHRAGGNAQDVGNVYGKILRLDVNGSNGVNGRYGVPGDNPFVGADGLDEVFAYGFRNPFRISFDHNTGALIAADVGQNDVEEIDLVLAGGNHGWRLKEGSFAFDPGGPGDDGAVTDDPVLIPPGLIDPVAEYDHDEGTAVIGGYVYRGNAIPKLAGRYVFGDLSGRLFHADLATGAIQELVLGLDDRDLPPFVLGFGEDEAGELYLLRANVPGPFGSGRVQRIVRVVPEPAAGSLLALALAALVLRRRLCPIFP
jgi:glucose/arabinose dehydrogenase